MAIDQAQFATDQEAMEGDWPQTMTHDGQSIPIIAGSELTDLEMVDAGFKRTMTREIQVRAGALTDAAVSVPTAGDTITIDSVDYSVRSVSNHDGIAYQITLARSQ